MEWYLGMRSFILVAPMTPFQETQKSKKVNWNEVALCGLNNDCWVHLKHEPWTFHGFRILFVEFSWYMKRGCDMEWTWAGLYLIISCFWPFFFCLFPAGQMRNMFIQTQSTPNPSSLMFYPGKPVMEVGSADFPNARTAMTSPLAKSIFGIDGTLFWFQFFACIAS